MRSASGRASRSEANPFGLAVFLAPVAVLAGGGPGELYRDSVYPNGCFGLARARARGGARSRQPDGKPVRHRHASRRLSVEPVGHLCAGAAAHLSRSTPAGRSITSSPTTTARRRSWPRTSSGRATSGRSTPPGCSTSGRAWSTSPSPGRSAAGRRVFMDFNRNPLASPGRPALQPRPARRGRARLPRFGRARPGAADRPAAPHEPAVDRALPPLQDRHRRASRWNSRSTTST